MTRDCPRILVVTGNNFNLVSGGGITLTNLFKGWPSDCIANVHEDATQEDHSVCRNFYRLSSKEIRWAWPFSLGQAWYDRRKRTTVAPADCASVQGASLINPHTSGWTQYARSVMGEGVPKYAQLSRSLTQWVDAFEPTLLYGFLGSLEQMGLIQLLANWKRIPMVVHMMDDWPSVLYSRGLLAPVVGPLVRRKLEVVFGQATQRMAICDDMCEEYRRRYDYDFLSFQNALDVDRWMPFRRRQWKAGSPFVVRYVGSIVPDGQRRSLQDICQAVEQLASCGEQIEMWVHTSPGDSGYLREAGFPSRSVHLERPPGQEDIARLLAEADLLVLPYNFDQRSVRYIKLSLPTKAPAYMISATPILVYAPSDVATAKYAMREGWGHVVSTQDISVLQDELRWLMKDDVVRQRLGERAHSLACERHNAATIRPAFWKALTDATQGLAQTGRAREVCSIVTTEDTHE